MSKLKTNKSAIKRFKITRHKILRRPTKQNHFNAKDTGKETRDKRGYQKLSPSDEKNIRKIMPYS